MASLKKRRTPLPDDICMCLPALGFQCRWCQRGRPTQISAEKPPWDAATLPERLRGFGHRGADQDGYDGSEWIYPQQDLEQQMIEAARVLLDAEEV
jgi:hypothetical protein